MIDHGELVAAEHYNVEGAVAMGSMPELRTSDVRITLVINGGQKISTRPKPDASFALLDVPPGAHLLEVFALGRVQRLTLVHFPAEPETFSVTAALKAPSVSHKRCSPCAEKWMSVSPW